MNSRKTAGAVLGTLGGLTALTAASAEIFYNFSINTKSPIHMSKLNNLIQKMASKSDGEESSAKYSGLTGTPRTYLLCPTLCGCTEESSKIPARIMFSSATDIRARPGIWRALSISFTPSASMFLR